MTGKQRSKASASEESGRRIKYMGTAHVREIRKGDTLSGEIPDGVPSTVVWTIANHHVAEVDWTDEQVEALCDIDFAFSGVSGKEFVDVTGKDRVEPSLHQVIFRGAKQRSKIAVDADLPEADSAAVDAHLSQSGGSRGSSGSSDNTSTDAPARATS